MPEQPWQRAAFSRGGPNVTSGFSPGLTAYFFDAHQWSQSPSPSAACVSLINSKDPKDQTAAQAGNMVALIPLLQLLRHFSASSEVVPLKPAKWIGLQP